MNGHFVALTALCVLLITPAIRAAETGAVALPPGVVAAHGLESAYREATATRERVCLNGLWRWQPAAGAELPQGRWGYFKVPGGWPGITDYMQKDCQSVIAHPDWKGQRLGTITTAWYEREISIPPEWAGRRIVLRAECLNSYAAVFIDGKKAGELRFPGGELDISAQCRPGTKQALSMQVTAMPLKGVMQSYTDTAAAREVKGTVQRRGLCGDVWLMGMPKAARIADVSVNTSVRTGEITVSAALEGLAADAAYLLSATVMREGKVMKESAGGEFKGSDVKNGHIEFSAKWKPEALWDLHTPENQFDVQVTLSVGGKVVDVALPVRTGFREFWIDGRDFYLNGTRIYLSSVPIDNAQVGAAWASYDGAKESMRRLKSFGINFVYTHNYGCEPGSHLSFAEILRAADDVGMLVALSQPHFSHYDWKAADAGAANGYQQHARNYVGVAGSHPSVVAYSMSHNATGYEEDMNPDLIDGIADPRSEWSARNAKVALRAEAIVKGLDPHRIVYHHASGNLGSMHAINYYANFAPIQEQSDWFEHWATRGVKPVFTCEYAVPFTWDWTLYRGWWKGQREFGSAAVPWEFCLAEWNAQFIGDKAYAISEYEKANLRWEAKQFRTGQGWHRWDYPNEVGSRNFDERFPVIAAYLSDNFRAFRTWGVSANSPWEHGHYWKLRPGVDRGRREMKVEWAKLQRPGFSADYIEQRYERVDLAYEEADWIATPAAQSLYRNNLPLLAYIAGKPAAFTSKDHVFVAGEKLEKQLIVINNSRRSGSAECEWTLALPRAISGKESIKIETGQQQRLPIRMELPAGLAAGAYELRASVKFDDGQRQEDTFAIHVMPAPPPVRSAGKLALFDPKGESAALLKQMGIEFATVDAKAELAGTELLIIGKSALRVEGPAPDLAKVREGLRVIVFEQESQALERRLGFRVVEYGLRNVFARVAGHPLLAGIGPEHLRDWRGEATLLSPRLKYESRPRFGPTVKWCDIPVPHLWRCGNRGNVASVLIEKPACGDFLPIVDGGYSLQYSPLMEYREGKGMVLFCQLDVTGRSEAEPAAQRLTRNILHYAMDWKPRAARPAVYVGERAGRTHLESAGFKLGEYTGQELTPEHLLVIEKATMAPHADALQRWRAVGGRVVALGIGEDVQDTNKLGLRVKPAEHIAAYFEPAAADSPLAGIAPADVHNRDPRQLGLIDGKVIGQIEDKAFFQMVPWRCTPLTRHNVKQTYRRASFATTRLLCNAGVPATTPLLDRFGNSAGPAEKRWLKGLYLDEPEEWDDPYRFFRW